MNNLGLEAGEPGAGREKRETLDEVNMSSRDKWEKELGLMVYLDSAVQL